MLGPILLDSVAIEEFKRSQFKEQHKYLSGGRCSLEMDDNDGFKVGCQCVLKWGLSPRAIPRLP